MKKEDRKEIEIEREEMVAKEGGVRLGKLIQALDERGVLRRSKLIKIALQGTGLTPEELAEAVGELLEDALFEEVDGSGIS